MVRLHAARCCAALLIFCATPAAAGEVVLDLRAALDRAAARAPEAIAARGRVGEAEATRVAASVRFPDNLELAVAGGPRRGAATTTDLSVELGQRVALGGRRGARRAIADATVAEARASAAAAVRAVELGAALAFYRALHAERVVDVARRGEELAARAAAVAARRRTAGDITDLDADLARAAAGRARAAVRAAEAARAVAVGELATVVAAAPDDVLVLRGDLGAAQALTLGALEPATAARPDLRALAAEGEVAAAERRHADALAWPELGLSIGYDREEDATILRAGLALSLPVWERGQGVRAEARARAARVAAEHEAAWRAASRQVRDAFAAYESAREAVLAFEADVVPVLDESDALLARSVDAGTVAVADYLVARQELLDGRREYLDRLLALAEARVTAQVVAGVAP